LIIAKTIKKEDLKSTDTIKDYISKLTTQKNIVLSHDRYGNIVITKLKLDTRPKAQYIEGIPSVKMSLSCNGQAMHSKISVLKQASVESDEAGQQVTTNGLIQAYRPTVKEQTSGDNADTENAAKMIRASELKNLKLTIETDRWRWVGKGHKIEVIRPNNIIEVISPSNFMSKPVKWFVESVNLKGNTSDITATLTCVLPETFTGETPKYIFQHD
jgi:prophage tail gpP-like protein